MMDLDDDDDDDDALIAALARTPQVTRFAGTDRYRVRACIGEGGFGVVYEVDDRVLGRRVALKTLKPQRAGYAANIQRLKREFRSVADLAHPNLVGLHELSSDGVRWFFTMDLVRGVDLITYVRGDEARIRAAFRQLVAAVSALHDAGVVHRDLKPSNVMVELDGRLVVLDFGLASSDDEPDLLDAGTPGYVAPERTVTPAADWYAVGVLLHEALTGRLPSGTPAPGKRATPAPPPDLEALYLALLRPDPHHRPDDAAIASVLGDTATSTATRAPTDPPPIFVGRDRELAALEHARVSVDGAPVVVRLHGQPGVGKSTVLARFLDAHGGDVVLAGRCHEREAVPFKAFDGVIDALVHRIAATPSDRLAAFRARDVDLVAQLFPAFELIADRFRDGEQRRAATGDARDTRLLAFAAIKAALRCIGETASNGGRLIVAIDDLQWGDVDSARLLVHLVSPPDPLPLLLVLSYRSDDASSSPTLREALRVLDAADVRSLDVAIDALPGPDAERLAAGLIGTDGDVARSIARRGEGHPMFVAELARAHRHAHTIVGPPPTLLDVLWQRVDRLSDAARAVLETISVAGYPLPLALCCEAAGVGDAGIDAMRVLRAEQLVRSGDRADVSVFHDRIRDAVLLHGDAVMRRERHLAIARCLERGPDPDAEALAHHFDAADHDELAADYALRASDVAMRALAFDRAASLLRLAIARGRGTAANYEKLGNALVYAGSNAAAGEAFLAAAEQLEPSSADAGERRLARQMPHVRGDPTPDSLHAIDLRRRVAEHMCSAGDFDAGYRALEHVLAEVGERMPSTISYASIEGAYHVLRMLLGRFRYRVRPEAEITPEELLRLDVLESASYSLAYLSVARGFGIMMRYSRRAMKTGELRRAGRSLVYGATGMIGLHSSSRPPRIDRLLDEAERIADRLDDARLRAMAYRMRAESHFMYGGLHQAKSLLETGVSLIGERCLGMGTDQRYMLMLAARVDLMLGNPAAARRVADALLLDAIERADPVAERLVRVNVSAPLCLAEGNVEGARDHLSRSWLEDRCGIILFRAEASASVATYRGRPREAVLAWRDRWPAINREKLLIPPAFRAIAVRSFALALLAAPASRAEIREAMRLARSIRGWTNPYAGAVRATLEAYRALHAGRAERAAARLADAARDYDACGMILDAAACRARRGALAGGDEGTAEVAAAEALLAARGIADPPRWVAMQLPPITADR